jgi:5-methylcytosine-specific restriction endonuclease McrA
MRKKTLILNGAYYPVNVVDWKDAMAHYFDEDSTVLAEYKDEYVHSVSQKFNLPAVIVVGNVNSRNRIMKFSSARLHIRDGYHCAYCGHKFFKSQLNVDHIIPRSKGGITSWTNCITSCISCNSKKRDRTPEEAGMPLLFKPFVPVYDQTYFRNWNGTVYEEWVPYIPETKTRRNVVTESPAPELKYGRVPKKGKK